MNGKDSTEKNSHVNQFGPIMIALRPEDGRTLGALPCFYFYSENASSDHALREVELDETDANGLFDLSEYIIQILGQISDVLVSAAMIEAVSRPLQDNDDRRLILLEEQLIKHRVSFLTEDSKRVHSSINAIKKLSHEDAKAIMDCFSTRSLSFADLWSALDIFFSNIQNSDARKRRFLNHYYEQREWRIVKNYAKHNALLCIDPDKEYKQAFSIKDAEFSTKICNFIKEINPNAFFLGNDEIAHTYCLFGVRSKMTAKRFSEFIDHVLIPKIWEPILNERLAYWSRRLINPMPISNFIRFYDEI